MFGFTGWDGCFLGFGAKVPDAENIFFAVDYIEDATTHEIYRTAKEGGALLFVVRDDRYVKNGLPDEFDDYEACNVTSGVLSFRAFITVAGWMIANMAKLLWNFAGRDTSFMANLLKLPLYRAHYRTLFNRFHPVFYWGRDQYNVQHILRRQELSRIGGQSLSTFNGIPKYTETYPLFQYVDFDWVYVLGVDFFEERYRRTWPRRMVLKGATSFRVERDAFARRLAPKPGDIGISLSVFVGDEAYIDFCHRGGAGLSG